MTMLLTAQGRDFIVAASDMRFTRVEAGHGTTMTELERKVVAIQGPYFKGVVQFCGLAQVGEHWTHDWLVKTLESIKAASLDPSSLHRELAREATARWITLSRRYSLSPDTTLCSFVSAGWAEQQGNAVAVHGIVSNFERPPNGPPVPAADPAFTGGVYAHRRDIKDPHCCIVKVSGSGSRSTMIPVWTRAIRGQVRKGATCSEIARLCGSIIAKESANPKLYDTVGSDALAVEIPFPGNEMRGAAIDDRGQEVVTFFPDLIQQGSIFRNVQVWSGEVPTGPDGSHLPPEQWSFLGRPVRR